MYVFQVVMSTCALGDDVVNLQVSELERGLAAVAAALLLAEEDMLVLAVGDRRVDVGATGPVV